MKSGRRFLSARAALVAFAALSVTIPSPVALAAPHHTAPAVVASTKVLVPAVKPTVTVARGDLAINVAKSALHCTGYEHAATAKEYIDFPGAKFGQLMVFKNFETGALCITQLATIRATGTLHLSSIEIFEADCATPITEVHANVKTRLVALKFAPSLAQNICIEGGNNVVLDPKKPRDTTFASGTAVINFI